jgi:competence protein ComEA
MLSGEGENMKRTLTLLCALLLTAALCYAQTTQSSDQSSSSTTSTTTAKSKKQAKNEASKDQLTPSDQKTDDSASPQASSNKSSTTTTTTTKTIKTTHSASSNLLDLNTATEADLTKLPGINAAKAQAISANRPYHAKNQLVSKGVLSKEEYEAVKGQVIAHRATASAAKSR